MYIEALGKDFPLCYTVEAQSKLAEKAGRLEDIQTLFDQEDAAESTENTVWILAVMMEAAVNKEKVKCRMLGEEYKGGEAPTYEDLRVLISPTEMKDVAAMISATMKLGHKTTVEVEKEKEKNAKTTQ